MIKMMTQDECQLVLNPLLDMSDTFIDCDMSESEPNFWERTFVKETSSGNEGDSKN